MVFSNSSVRPLNRLASLPPKIMNACAYCGFPGSLTKEHIWPESLILKYESLKTYNPRTNKYYIGDPVVKDVCAKCNNGRLSILDSYLSEIYDKYLGRLIDPGESAQLEYNYELLLRSLLKISFNSSRASQHEKSKSLHKAFAQFILSGGYCSRVALRLQIVTNSRRVDLIKGSEDAFKPLAMRCAILAYDGPLARRFLVRMIAINSYWFYLIIPYKAEPEHKWREFLLGLSNWRIPAGVTVSPQGTKMHINVNQTTFLHPELLGSLVGAEGA